MVDARLDVLYMDACAMEKLSGWMKSMTKSTRPCMKYIARKMLAWYTKYPPKNDGAAAAVEASAPPPRTPDRPTTPAYEPRQKRGMALSDDEGQADK
jgi:hypothetical protein